MPITYKIRLNGGALVDYVQDVGEATSWDQIDPAPATAADTDYALEVAAIDEDENVSAYSAPVTVHTDAAPPSPMVVLAHCVATIVDAGNGPGVTSTPARNTTGATGLLLFVNCYNGGGGAFVISEEVNGSPETNDWEFLGTVTGDNMNLSALLCKAPAHVGVNHIITATGGSIYAAVGMYAFTQSDQVAEPDAITENGLAGGATIQPTAALLPSLDQMGIFGAFGYYAGGVGATGIDDPDFTIDDARYDSGDGEGMTIFHEIQTTAASVQPTLTKPGSAGKMNVMLVAIKHA